jgi:hypothetical protein
MTLAHSLRFTDSKLSANEMNILKHGGHGVHVIEFIV